ncbi:c-type cytochrome [Paracraurococcus lichenis]|uniref:C-type cytochrome n=1 Tax=Paracraurococcus lichenis TaxID=3064888 RepID=A0ABT9E0G7_9PROT|nr:c-type cytochrome [Paracraurococcus sp. LOR1-02]MDO9709617.1 c-type cytochrome [Paracraurococcus sp. LOR1-02]
MPPSRLLAAAVLAAGLPAMPLAQAAGPAPLAAQGCLGCHGPDGTGMGAIPRLAGREAPELAAILRDYRADRRPATIMNRIARGYTEAEIDSVSAWFAAVR